MTDAAEPAMQEFRAEKLAAFPITTFSTAGTLQLSEDRIRFVTESRGKVLLDAPLSEVHTPQKMAGPCFRFWHGSKRWRFSAGVAPLVRHMGNDSVTGAIATAASLPEMHRRDTAARSAARQWVEVLEARATGTPPDGFRPGRPWPGWAWGVAVVGVVAVWIGVITAIVFATG
jgi:hypothetical protein